MHSTLLPWARLFQVCYKNDTLLYIREKAGSKEMNQPLLSLIVGSPSLSTHDVSNDNRRILINRINFFILSIKCYCIELDLFHHGKKAVGTCW